MPASKANPHIVVFFAQFGNPEKMNVVLHIPNSTEAPNGRQIKKRKKYPKEKIDWTNEACFNTYMNNMFIATIHNSSLGVCRSVSNWDEGVKEVKKMAEEILRRQLTEEEQEDLESMGEIHDFSDFDNHFSFSIGVIE